MWGISKAGVEVPGAAPVRPGRPEALEEEVNGDDWEALLPKRSRCEHDAALRAPEKLHSGVAREAPLLMRANPFIFWFNNKSKRKIYFLWLFLMHSLLGLQLVSDKACVGALQRQELVMSTLVGVCVCVAMMV
jgi:hypothetical protein